ncbi:hypothetical protein M23134_05688 [Microscilla marina ATCC 23134]|uniref:Uncharacterized protein n=2 Tax=Microscilla marina TaxID=1027 RepID=A1ZIE7_MICM2|nr:hypothetical protein M23134_05688 [Microscilla marina ATCC 23134]
MYQMNHQTSTPVNYKKHMRFDMTALIENNISIKTDEYVILDWAHDLACDGSHPSVVEAGIEYFELSADRCLQELPTLGVGSKQSIQKKFERLVRQGLLVSHPYQKNRVAYYGFTSKAKKLFTHFGLLDSTDTYEISEQAKVVSQMLKQIKINSSN